jgi:hypothetical protein
MNTNYSGCNKDQLVVNRAHCAKAGFCPNCTLPCLSMPWRSYVPNWPTSPENQIEFLLRFIGKFLHFYERFQLLMETCHYRGELQHPLNSVIVYDVRPWESQISALGRDAEREFS